MSLVAGDAGVAGPTSVKLAAKITAADLFASLESELNAPFWVLGDPTETPLELGSSIGLGVEDPFCEVFTDLSDYLLSVSIDLWKMRNHKHHFENFEIP